MDFATVARWLSSIDIVKTSLLVVASLIGLVMLIWLGRRLRKPSISKLAGEEGGCGFCARLWARVTRLLDAIDYLATRREWRYKQPWVLMLGEQGAGKSSLIRSVSPTWRHAPPARASELKAEGMRWSFLRYGVLIDAEGALASAEQGSDNAAKWMRGLDALDALRPERPLDGLVLCVSARSLRGGKRAQREALAAQINRQIGLLQDRIEFMLPVYVVVTQCDDIPGFSAFWRTMYETRRGEMFGYSAIAQDQSQQPAEWADAAFDQLGARLREVQVDIAALSERIDDIDGFFLFPEHFRSLREPVAQWLETVFRATAWQSGHLFRGLYFTGSVEADGGRAEAPREDVDFVDALVCEKVLREPALARPTRQGLWSRNRLIRRAQFAGVAIALCMFVALGISAYRASGQVDAIVGGIASLGEIAPRVPSGDSGECLAREDVYPMLAHVARIETRSRYPAIPLSWVDSRLTHRSAAVVGRSAVQTVLMPTFACQLEKRARDLLAESSATVAPGEAGLSGRRAAFRRLVAEARTFEQNLKRYESLAGRGEPLDERRLISTLDGLARYAFGEPLPREVWRSGGVLDNAFHDVHKVRRPVLPYRFRHRLADAIKIRSENLRSALSREVAVGVDLIDDLEKGSPPILDKTRRLGLWLRWVQGSWLGATAERNPCREIVAANQADIRALTAYFGDLDILDGALREFDDAACRQAEMRVLADMRLAPYGPLFVPDKHGLALTPALRDQLSGIPDLVALPYMQLRTAAPFRCVGGAVSWRAAEIAEAAGYLDQYEAYAKSRKAPALPDGGEPFYLALARSSLAYALDDALRRAQQTPANPEYDLVAPVRSDAQLSAVSAEFARGLPSLQRVLNAYATLGLDGGGASVRQCARDFAADNLGGVDALADGSRLYAPPVSAGDDEMFALGAVPVTRDFLARQMARAQVLGGYAEPFIALLGDTPGVDDASRDAPQTAAYWRNTLDEIARYTKGKEPAGQAANLDAFYVGRLSGMSYANCASLLAAYKPPEYGNDLFSDRRRTLERQVGLRCNDRGLAQAEEIYGALAKRFNRDLAGRYPFAGLDARDADPGAVRAFFLDYAAQRQSVADTLRDLGGERWRAASRFVADLDAAADFFATNLAAPGQMEPIAVSASFPADAGQSAGADQLVIWRLRIGGLDSVFPNGAKDLQWFTGDAVSFALQWAAGSQWRPTADPVQPGLDVRDTVASFTDDGPWALLRFVEAHRAPAAGQGAGPGAGPVALRFTVPVQGAPAEKDGKPARGEARVFMHWRLSGTHPATKTEQAIAPPAQFPRGAPAL